MGKIIVRFRNILAIIAMEMKIDKRLIIFEVLLAFTQTIETLIVVLMPAFVIDMLLYFSEKSRVYICVFVLMTIFAFCGLFTKILTVVISAYGFKMENLVGLKLQQKMMKLDFKHSEEAEKLKRYSLVRGTFYKFMDVDYNIFTELLGAILGFIVMSMVMMRISLILFVVVVLFAVLLWWLEGREARYEHCRDEEKEQFLDWKNYFIELLYSVENEKEIKLYDAEDYIVQKYEKVTEKMLKIDRDNELFKSRMSVKKEIVFFLQNIAVYVSAICKFIVGGVTVGNFYIYISAGQYLVDTVSRIINVFGDVVRASLYFDDFNSFMEMEDSQRSNTRGSKRLNKIDCVEFKNVSFRYKEDSELVLKNVSCKIEGGKRVAIVGDNGAGKSTFIKLLLGLYAPTEGKIFVNGVEMSEYNYGDYIKQLAPVFQDVRLMGYSILENIVLDNEINNSRLEESLVKSQIKTRIDKLEKGVHSIVSKDLSEEGINFSGGEEQKIALARAIYKDSSLLILDEPMSALDALAERDLYYNLADFSDNKTLVLISHRIPSVIFCDNILVFADGEILEQGSHEQLMGKKGIYREMYDKQSSYYISEEGVFLCE